MPIEAPRLIDPTNPTPEERLARFDYQTTFVSSMDGMRSHKDFQALVEMGQEAVPIVISSLQKRPTWIALALNDLSGQDAVGLNSDMTRTQGITVEQLRENALAWAEAESLIEIRDKAELYAKGRELMKRLYQAFLAGRPEVSEAMTHALFKGEDLEHDSLRRVFVDLQLDGNPARLWYQFIPIGYIDYQDTGPQESIEIRTKQRNWAFVQVTEGKEGGIIKVSFSAEGKKPNTRAAYESIGSLSTDAGRIRNYHNIEADFLPRYAIF